MKTTALITPHLIASLQPRAKEYTLHDARCDGLAIRVQPSGAMSWVTWLREGGKTRRVTLGKLAHLSPDDARDAQRNTVATAGVDTPAPRRTCLTFNELAAAFVANKRGVYTTGSLDSLQVYLRTQLRPAIGTLPVDRITTRVLLSWFSDYSATSAGGANQALGHFITIFNWGQHREQKLLPYDLPNPTRLIRRNKRRAVGRMLNAQQIAKLVQALNVSPRGQRDAAHAIHLILLTGCRSGEILRLKWADVRHDSLYLSRAKTGPRRVELSQSAARILDLRQDSRTSPYVFPSKRGRKPYLTSVKGVWRRLKVAAEIEPGFRLHDLRHTYASHALQSGETLYMTGQLLGHKGIRSTERYAHLDGTYLIKAARSVSKEIARLLG